MMPLLQEFSLCRAIYKFGTGEKQRFFNVNSLRNELGNDITLFHAFTKCGTVSSSFMQYFDTETKCHLFKSVISVITTL